MLSASSRPLSPNAVSHEDLEKSHFPDLCAETFTGLEENCRWSGEGPAQGRENVEVRKERKGMTERPTQCLYASNDPHDPHDYDYRDL